MNNGNLNLNISELIGDLRSVFSKYSGTSSTTTAVEPDQNWIRNAVLLALVDEKLSAVEVIAKIKTGTRITLTNSQVYPTLEALEIAGELSSSIKDERKVYAITKSGKEAAGALKLTLADLRTTNDASNAASISKGNCPEVGVLKSGAQLAQAVSAIANSGTKAQQAEAAKLLDETRRKLYAMLAE